MTQVSREVEGQIPISYKTSRSISDNNAKQVIAGIETQKGQAVESNVEVIQLAQPLKGSNVNIMA